MLYTVTIAAAGLGGVAPANGFIDPTPIERYRQRVTYTSTVTSPTTVAGTSLYIRDVPVVLTGTNVAALVTAINAKSYYHHVVASLVDTNTRLVLTMLPGYDNLIPTVSDITPGITALIGFTNPTIGATPAQPTTLAVSEQKERGNIRWNLVLESLQLTSNVGFQILSAPAGNITTDPTSVVFTLDVPNDYYHYDFSGNIVYADNAIKHAIAKAMMFSVIRLVKLYDPTDVALVAPVTPKQSVLLQLTVGALTANQATALGAVTVTI
jgi:hypothetical protein